MKYPEQFWFVYGSEQAILIKKSDPSWHVVYDIERATDMKILEYSVKARNEHMDDEDEMEKIHWTDFLMGSNFEITTDLK